MQIKEEAQKVIDMPNRHATFEALAAKARQSQDSMDVRIAMRFGIENRISNQIIRKALSR